MEYISRDKIILATQLENFKTNFKDYNGLYFFNTNEPKDIALLIEELIINYNQYLSKKLNNGSEIIRKNYTWSIQAKKIDTFLKTL